MEPNPLSIIIPTYCRYNRLKELIHLLQKQTTKDDQIIVIDDASKDDTSKIATEYPEVTYFKQETNKGVAAARNKGVELAANSSLIFFDDDIIPCENYLKSAREYFAKHEEICIQGPHHVDPANNKTSFSHAVEALIWRSEMEYIQVSNQTCSTLYSQAFCISKCIFEESGGFSEDFPEAGCEEFEFASRLMNLTPIAFSTQLLSGHFFQSYLARIKTLWKRTEQLSKVYARSSSSWKLSQLSIQCRLLTASMMSLGVILLPLMPMHVFLFIALLLFLCLEWSLFVCAVRFNKLYLLPAALFTRYLHYNIMLMGYVKSLAK